MANYENIAKNTVNVVSKLASDVLLDSEFISRTIGMNNSYEGIMTFLELLGREPVSLLGKDYVFIYDHVRRNVMQGEYENAYGSRDCPKFTYYKEIPTIRFANPYLDPMNYLGNWTPDMEFHSTINSQAKHQMFYSESNDDAPTNIVISDQIANGGTEYGSVASYGNDLDTCDLIKKTNDIFKDGKCMTLLARFHGKNLPYDDQTQTALSYYGMSHGRNLLKLVPDAPNGYDNPYCRVWTYHHQYSTLKDTIRPFDGVPSQEALEKKFNPDGVSFRVQGKDGEVGGSGRLDKYGVLNYENGMVHIAPTAKLDDYFGSENGESNEVDKYHHTISPKRCMFSIENLAWKNKDTNKNTYDPLGLSPEQKGPLGGRIMWFPPYNLEFNENVTVNWNSNNFIGRGEPLYTYTNTVRSGNLSFTVLIDHPSIIDYWTGHDGESGVGQDGNKLVPRNVGGVDEKNNHENTLLRFFAGCDILTAKNQTYKIPKEYEKIEEPTNPIEEEKADVPEPIQPDPTPTVEAPEPVKKRLVCFLYYPNNYSGVDDRSRGGSKVYAIDYLMNGVGAQKEIASGASTATDFAVDIENKVSGGYVGGYEIRNVGVSIINKPLQIGANVPYATTAKAGEYITSENPTNITKVTINGKEHSLAKQWGSLVSKPNKVDSLYYRRRWYYRVDKAYENQVLTHEDSYLDAKSFGLNGKNGYQDIQSHLSDFGVTLGENDKLVSFADFFVALEANSGVNGVLSGYFDQDNVDLINEIMTNSNKYTVTKVEFNGFASQQGYSQSSPNSAKDKLNQDLARNRAQTMQNWFASKAFPCASASNAVGVKPKSLKNHVNVGQNSTELTKMWRSACCIIDYEQCDIEEANKVDADANVDVLADTSTTVATSTSPSVSSPSDNGYGDYYTSQLEDSITSDYYMKANVPKIQEQRMKLLAEQNKLNIVADDGQILYRDGVKLETSGTVNRYDNEGEFFQEIARNDNVAFLRNLITDKVKYFDPAFHSVSPEGFNARLTFLNQCTRQGSTTSNSAFESTTAYNLAFGRPPVCVLRIGDFFNTKIVITSLGIKYSKPNWDMNPEGIGMMPMFADIDMQFTFIGGSDLGGPIARLQNAVSFNYYANTSVYDNRAETVEYDVNGSGEETHFKPYVYPNTNLKKN